MKHLVNKSLLYLLCAISLPIPISDSYYMTSYLLILAVTCLLNIFTPRKSLFLIALYSTLTIYDPVFAPFLPLIVYDAGRDIKICPLSSACAAAALLFFAAGHSPAQTASLLILSLLAFTLQYYSFRTELLIKAFYRYQDESTESSLSLKEKNRALIRQQDTEIHLATLSERNRIAREIHDNVGHLLTRSILQTGALKVINRDERIRQPIEELHETLNAAMSNIRNSVHDLHDESVSLEQSLHEIAANADSFHVSVECNAGLHIPKDVKYAFIAITKEAVHNVQKHSNADKIHVCVQDQPAFYQLRISDNGKPAGPIQNTGIGLSNMEERIHMLGGTIHFSTNNGFQIFISVPRRREN